MAPIHVAARNMDVDALRLELERGVDPNLICPVFLRAGASLPTDPYHGDPYIQRVVDAGGIANYERGHLASRVATFTPKLAHLLPPELVRRVVAFWMHAGDY